MASLLASRDPGAIREALVRRGMDEASAASTASGLHPVTVFLDKLSTESTEALTGAALVQGIDVVSGDNWAAISGSTSRIAGFARSAAEVLPGALARDIGECLRTVSEPQHIWRTGRGSLPVDRPIVVGILNVTPDSFSDGGLYVEADSALGHASRMIEAGADMIDIGGESTRPGAPAAVPVEDEWKRIAPVIERLSHEFTSVPLSVDTVKSEIADRALSAGAWAVNDVSALRLDSRLADVCAAKGSGLILSHSRGPFSEMAGYEHATYTDVTKETAAELTKAVELAESRGVNREQIVIDPGLGFAKRPEQNWELIRGLPLLASLGFPIMVGPSRKRFLGAITGMDAAHRDTATAAACVAAFLRGAYLFRVHDVARVKASLAVAEVLRSS